MEARRHYRQVPSFNLVVVYHRPRIFLVWLAARVFLVLMIAAELLFIPKLHQQNLSLVSATAAVQRQIKQVEKQVAAELAAVEARKKEAKAAEQEAKKLAVAIELVKKQHEALATDWMELSRNPVDWSGVVAAVFRLKPLAVELSSVKRDGMKVNVTGTAADYATLLGYRRQLLTSPAISQIVSLTSTRATESRVSFSLVVECKVRAGDAAAP